MGKHFMSRTRKKHCWVVHWRKRKIASWAQSYCNISRLSPTAKRGRGNQRSSRPFSKDAFWGDSNDFAEMIHRRSSFLCHIWRRFQEAKINFLWIRWILPFWWKVEGVEIPTNGDESSGTFFSPSESWNCLKAAKSGLFLPFCPKSREWGIKWIPSITHIAPFPSFQTRRAPSWDFQGPNFFLFRPSLW